jgi:hypothetical protein
MTSVVIYCDGPDKGLRHERVPVARYDKPYRVGDDEHDKWGPVRSWRDGDSLIVVPEFERWVTDDDDESRATNLSIRKLRQLFRYRCELCKPEFDLQRHTYNHQFDVKTARDRVLDAVAERGGQITVRQLATAWKYQIAQTRRR